MKTYLYNEVYKASTDYFRGDELAAKVFVDKYALSNDNVYLELTPDDMHMRLAKEFSRIEQKYPNPMSEDEIYSLLKDFKYIVPQGSPMSGIGNPYQVMSISNCFVLESPFDSYSGILKTDQEQAHIMRRRGGVGFDISTIRPKGMITKNAAKTTDGIGIFMERYSNTCREVAQGGRRGALLLSISIHHPEIRTFINIKKDLKKVTGANISIRLSDEFMMAVKNNEKVQLRWPVDSSDPAVSEYVDANEIWDDIISAAHGFAEPGLLFWDTALKYTPAQIYKDFGFNHISTNPCGEIILSAGDSCRLLLLNLSSFVNNIFTPEAYFDYEKFADVAIKAQRLMDDIVDLELECIERILNKIEKDPEPDDVKLIDKSLWITIRDACIKGRRTGLGITGLGDAIAYLNQRYGSDESITTTEEIYKSLAINSYKSSCIMAGERGAFPVFSHKLEEGHPYLQRIWDASPEVYELYLKHGRRNIANLTTPPAGSTSCETQTTSGIESAFLISYVRRKKVNPDSKNVKVDFVDVVGDSWQEYTVYHHGYKKWTEMFPNADVKDSPYFGATSVDVDWISSVKLQAAAQKWVCHSISRTINVPNNTSTDTVKNIYMTAWESGCKGVTVYRDGCRSGVLISEESKSLPKDGRPSKITRAESPKRPKELPCEIHHATFKKVKWTVLVGLFKGEPYEIFMGYSDLLDIPLKISYGSIIKTGKGRYNLNIPTKDDSLTINNIIKTFDNNDSAWATRMISTSLRHGVPVEFLVEQLSKDGTIVDINNILARILRKYAKNGGIKCPKCGGTNIIFRTACFDCVSCGHSGCG